MSVTFAVILVVTPGDTGGIKLSDGSVLTISATGDILRDGVKQAGTVQRLVQFGPRVYAQGKVTPTWWLWTNGAWSAAPKFDETMLVDLVQIPPPISPVIPPPPPPPPPPPFGF